MIDAPIFFIIMVENTSMIAYPTKNCVLVSIRKQKPVVKTNNHGHHGVPVANCELQGIAHPSDVCLAQLSALGEVCRRRVIHCLSYHDQ